MVEDTSPPNLAETDWQQGSLLPVAAPVTPTMWVHDERQLEPKALRAARREQAPFNFARAQKPAERLLVISQTCDVIKPAELLPQVEVARVFGTANETVLAQARNMGSARYFRLAEAESDGEWWVLDYGWRSFIDKGFLVVYEPDNSVLASFAREDEARLSTWLGRRNGRPALSDLDVEQICDPVRRRFERLHEEEPETMAPYSEEFSEFRFRREPDQTVTLFLLSPKADPDPLVTLEVMDVLREAITEVPVQFASDKVSYSTFTKADELSTEQIDLYWASYEEGTATGEIPPP